MTSMLGWHDLTTDQRIRNSAYSIARCYSELRAKLGRDAFN